MSTLLYGIGRENAPDLPADAREIRSTVTVVDNAEPAAVAPGGPDYNQIILDRDSEGGLTTRQMASAVVPSVRYLPSDKTQDVNAAIQTRVDDTISTGGTAAARERAGEWGHGTLKVVDGIEPTIVDGHQFGNDYFAVDERGANPTTDYMTGARDPDSSLAAAGAANTRDAVAGSQAGGNIYQQMLDGFVGGSK